MFFTPFFTDQFASLLSCFFIFCVDYNCCFQEDSFDLVVVIALLTFVTETEKETEWEGTEIVIEIEEKSETEEANEAVVDEEALMIVQERHEEDGIVTHVMSVEIEWVMDFELMLLALLCVVVLGLPVHFHLRVCRSHFLLLDRLGIAALICMLFHSPPLLHSCSLVPSCFRHPLFFFVFSPHV